MLTENLEIFRMLVVSPGATQAGPLACVSPVGPYEWYPISRQYQGVKSLMTKIDSHHPHGALSL